MPSRRRAEQLADDALASVGGLGDPAPSAKAESLRKAREAWRQRRQGVQEESGVIPFIVRPWPLQ